MTYLFAGTAFNQVIQFASNDKHFHKTIYGTPARSPVRSITLDIAHHRVIYSNSHKIFTASQNQTTQEIVALAGQQQILSVQYFNPQAIRYCLSDGSIFLQNCAIPTEQSHFKQEKVQNFIGQKHNKFNTATANFNRDRYLFCGIGVVPIICNLTTGVLDWYGKNVKNDELDLEVPMKDIDAKIVRQDKFIAILNADRKLRIYDIRGTHRRPVQDINLQVTPKSQMTKMKISQSENEYYFSNDIGQIYKCDSRKDYKVIGKYKGINSSITDLHISSPTKNQLIASSLDSYVRIFDLQSCKLIKKYYVNKPLYSLAVLFDQEQTTKQEQEGEEEEINLEEEEYEPKKIQKLKQIRKRNKVGLKYLQPREFDEPQVKKEQVIQKEWYEDLNPIDRRDFQQ